MHTSATTVLLVLLLVGVGAVLGVLIVLVGHFKGRDPRRR